MPPSIHLRFLIVGAVNTLVGYGIFSLLYIMANRHLHYIAIAVFAHFLAVCVAFASHKFVVFRSRGSWWPEFIRFNLAQLLTLGAGTLSLVFLVEYLQLHPLAAQALTLALTVTANFFLHRIFSFRQSPPAS